jgi:hypothetical protein
LLALHCNKKKEKKSVSFPFLSLQKMTTEKNIDFYYESGIPGVASPLQLPTLLEDEKRLMRITSILEQDKVPETIENQTTEGTEQMDGVEKVSSANEVKKRGGYRLYTEEQIAKLLYLKTELCMTTAEAARSTGIVQSTAYSMVKKYEADPQHRLPIKTYTGRMGPQPILSEIHTSHIIQYIEKNPTAAIDDVMDSLCASFENLELAKSTVHNHIKEKCGFTLKRVEKIPQQRNSIQTVDKRADWAAKWINSDMNFLTNCVFIDEAGFYLHMIRNVAWSKKGEAAKVQVPNSRATSITIFGAICSAGIIDLTLRKPRVVKKRKLASGKMSRAKVSEGTTTEDYLEFIDGLIEIMKEKGFSGYYFVMDNAPIHSAQKVEEKLTEAGHYCVFLPPYSPFLNPIEEFWSKLKSAVKRDRLNEDSLLSDKLREASKKISLQDLHGWITHSTEFFSRCMNKEIDL